MSFKSIEQNSKIIITAPHAFEHYRPNLTSVMRSAEIGTSEIAKNVASYNKINTIYLDSSSEYDPNYAILEKNKFKQELSNIASKNKTTYLLDIHGLSEEHNYDIAVYYPRRFSKSKRLAESFISKSQEIQELSGISIQLLNFNSNNQETLAEFATRELKMGAIQIEIAQYLREEEMYIRILQQVFNNLIPTLN